MTTPTTEQRYQKALNDIADLAAEWTDDPHRGPFVERRRWVRLASIALRALGYARELPQEPNP